VSPAAVELSTKGARAFRQPHGVAAASWVAGAGVLVEAVSAVVSACIACVLVWPSFQGFGNGSIN
jgi:hypothetical protein